MIIAKYHNWELEKAIREAGKDSKDIAKDAGLDAGIFSQIKRGRMRPTDKEEKAISQALAIPVSKLFILRSDLA